jgi:uncharacterized membrane protein YgcG
MKRFLPALALLTLTAATPMFGLDPANTAPTDRDPRDTRDTRDTRGSRDRTSVIDDVIRMSNAGVTDDAIIKFVRESRDQYVVDADVIIALTDAKVSKPVLEAVMDQAYDRGDNDRRDDRRDARTTTRTVYVRPDYDPWYYSSAFYDPYWYAPRLSIGFGFGGFRGGYRGGYHGGGHRGGGGSHGGHGRH